MKKPIELKQVKNVFYMDYLNEMCIVFDYDKPKDKPPKNKNPKIKKDELYYYHVKFGDVRFPDFFGDRYILLKFLYVFPSTADNLGLRWQPLKGFEQKENSVLFYFCVLDMKYHLKDVESGTKLRMLYDTVMDNNFFDHIPQVNAISHFDNSIISNVRTVVDFELNKNSDNWDKFNIFSELIFNPDYEVKKGSNLEHDFFCD